MRTDILEQKERILQWIAEEKAKTYMCEQLHCKPETLNSYMKKMGIEYAGQQSRKGRNIGQGYMSALEYLGSGSTIKSHTLKLKLYRDGLKERKCELCGISQWQGVDLPLELHHKDGDHYNNNLDNLIILCPNCHSIQEGNSGKAVKSKEEIAKLTKEVKRTAICIVCGKPITRNSTYCPECYARESRVVERPSREELKNLIRTTSFLQIGKTYNVSDNAVRKWCDSYGLPRKSSEIKSYSDEEWEKI